jgi:hypothetical protein
LSLFYVNTPFSPPEVFTKVSAVMDVNDRLAVINGASSLGAVVTTWDRPPVEAINAIWVAG